MNKQSGFTLSTTINGSRSCYITTKRFAFLSDKTILARTIDISNNILNWLRIFFKYENLLTKRQEKGTRLIFKKNIEHLAHRRALRTLIIASAQRLKSLFVQATFSETFCIRTIHVSNENNSAIVKPTMRGECATQCNCSQKCQTFRQKNSILVEMFDFAVTQVDNFCKNEFIIVLCNFFDGKNACLVLLKPER